MDRLIKEIYLKILINYINLIEEKIDEVYR
jgi:hypothetical protein